MDSENIEREMTDSDCGVSSGVSSGENCDAVNEATTSENEHPSRLAAECEGLEPQVMGRYVIGRKSDINGADAELVDFQPTRAELKTLARHYLDRHYNEQLCSALGYSGSWEWREIEFTWQRFCTIEEAPSPGKPIKEFDLYIERREAEIDKVARECGSLGTEEDEPKMQNGKETVQEL